MSGNDGHPMQVWPHSQAANQDKKYFALGSSPARPAAGYFADVADLPNEKVLADAVKGLTDAKAIEDALFGLLHDDRLAREYMRWRMGIKSNAPRP